MPSVPAAITYLATLAMGGFITRIRLLRKYGFDWPLLPRMVVVLFLSFLTIPLRMLERLLFFKRIREEKLSKPPVFILGHWRSGTTFLHMLMCQDKQWGYVTSTQVIGSKFSELLEVPFVSRLAYALMPENRAFDNVALFPDSPQEDELAIADRLPNSIFHYFCFPKACDDLLRYTSFADATPEEIASFKLAYHTILQKASISSHGKQLLVKNPANTPRAPLLMKMYPGAKFIHISREPYSLFCSIYHQHDVMTKFCSLHTVTKELLQMNVIKFFKTVTYKYLEDRHLIPKGSLSEVRFEDLVKDPKGELKRMYTELDLSGYDEALPHFQAFLDAQKEYKQNEFKKNAPEVVTLVNKHWQFAFKEWNYEMQKAE